MIGAELFKKHVCDACAFLLLMQNKSVYRQIQFWIMFTGKYHISTVSYSNFTLWQRPLTTHLARKRQPSARGAQSYLFPRSPAERASRSWQDAPASCSPLGRWQARPSGRSTSWSLSVSSFCFFVLCSLHGARARGGHMLGPRAFAVSSPCVPVRVALEKHEAQPGRKRLIVADILRTERPDRDKIL